MPRLTIRRKLTRPRGTGRSGLKRWSSSASLTSSQARSWKKTISVTRKAVAKAGQAGSVRPPRWAETLMLAAVKTTSRIDVFASGKRSAW
jgi:hypothetical protein